MGEVRKLQKNEAGAVAAMMARSFQDDPALSWAVPDPERRRRLLPRYFEVLQRRVYIPKGESYTHGDGVSAALWAPPDAWETGLGGLMWLLPTMVKGTRTKLPRALKMLELVEKKHRLHAEPHYYLGFVATDPDRQGQGHGSALLEHMTRRCDDDGIGAYLEATSIGSQALYHRHRFEVVEELHWPEGGPPLWRMWRDPVSG